ncbi:MAG: type II toxin-antitoxin system RelE/ParE family toxin [Candidatus Electrothrix sp. MAN1_4]|nr:type II toxin-antitoxin system RelE/ParE family toxin [Candidatus Electrothrix sp. MAN1_4]
MTKRYEVIWTKTAENDLLKIIEYIAQNNPANSIRVLKKIKKQTEDLYHSPKRCRIVPELYDQGISQYREMIITPWRIMYRISDDTVYVLSVLDSRRNIEDILLKRFTQNIL